MQDHLSWRIVAGSSPAADATRLPGSLLTIPPPFDHEDMPKEVSILLPTNAGPTDLIDRLTDDTGAFDDVVLGLFLANPFLNIKVDGARLVRAGVRWIANLPSVVQQDEEFSRQLADVELGFDRELDYLSGFRGEGFRVAVVVADARSAAAAAAIEPEAMIVLPRIAEFAAGFPSLHQRHSAAQSVAESARAAGWSGALLGFGDDREADNEALWPGRLDGLVCRPVAAGPLGLTRTANGNGAG